VSFGNKKKPLPWWRRLFFHLNMTKTGHQCVRSMIIGFGTGQFLAAEKLTVTK
jgi:hypothetical protein